MSLQHNLNLGQCGKEGVWHQKEGRVWHDYNYSWSTTKTENEKCFALHNYTYCRVSSCISWCCGWSEFPLPRKEFGIERDDEKHNFMVYGNLPPATWTLTLACKSVPVKASSPQARMLHWLMACHIIHTPRGLILRIQCTVTPPPPKPYFLDYKTHFFPWKVRPKIDLSLIHQG